MKTVKISIISVHVSLVLPSLIDRLGDSKDQVRDQDQALLLKIMDQAANPQVQHSTHVSRVSERSIDHCLIISTSELCVFSSCGSE